MFRKAFGWLRGFYGELLDTLFRDSTTYRPELHYMRGPGPAWHRKYGKPYNPVDAAKLFQTSRKKPLSAQTSS